jgi:hypothetical protein
MPSRPEAIVNTSKFVALASKKIFFVAEGGCCRSWQPISFGAALR